MNTRKNLRANRTGSHLNGKPPAIWMHARMLGLKRTFKFELYVNLPKRKVAASIFLCNKTHFDRHFVLLKICQFRENQMLNFSLR